MIRRDHRDLAAKAPNAWKRARLTGLVRASTSACHWTPKANAEVLAIGEHDRRITMKTSIIRARRTVVHAARKVSHLRMERAAESDIHLLKPSADSNHCTTQRTCRKELRDMAEEPKTTRR
jgi:hypothetical protein